ncbi:MAG: hypothetical protein U9Q77_04090 [Candidatus Marinimicrobia bacterium]|nr:hypothetical protein [Candidatus Neomarinimicrobiota bacterium]
MRSTSGNFSIRSLIITIIFVFPLLGQSQVARVEVGALHMKIDKLNKMLTQLKADQHRSRNIGVRLETPARDYSKLDSLRLVALHRKQAESRSRIDILTLEIIKLSRQLDDPKRRYALAKRMQEHRTASLAIPDNVCSDTTIPFRITARSINLAAVKLIRQGKSLDQARLLIIDNLSNEQVLTFYRDLPRIARYHLYDIADEMANTDAVDLMDARRSAIYFHLFTK